MKIDITKVTKTTGGFPVSDLYITDDLFYPESLYPIIGNVLINGEMEEHLWMKSGVWKYATKNKLDLVEDE